MNITGLLLPLAFAPAILKFVKDSGSKNGNTVTPPTSKAGLRPVCGIGKRARFDPHLDKYICVVDFD